MTNAAQISKLGSSAITAPPEAAASESQLAARAVMGPPQNAADLAALHSQVVFAPPQDGVSISKIRFYAVITEKVIIVPDYTWPASGASALVPRRAKLQPMPFNTSGGQGFTSAQQVIGNTPGMWRLDLSDVRVKTDAQRMQWEVMEVGLQGRAKTILVPIFRWMTALVPWPTGAGGVVTSADSHYATPVIFAYANAQILEGAVAGVIRMETGADLVAGHVWEFENKVYFITEVVSQTPHPTSPVSILYSVKFWPPMRTRIEQDERLEFDNPRLRCRLEKDDGMTIQGGWDYWRRGAPSVSFVEDVTDTP